MLQSSPPKRLPISLLRKAASAAVQSVPSERARLIASLVFEWYLGPEWIQQLNTSTSRLFLFRKPIVRQNLLHEFNRLINLGEMLLNLRDIDGIGEVVGQLHDQQIELALAQLEVGRILAAHGIKFHFVGPYGGNRNCGLELIFPQGVVAARSGIISKIGLREFRCKPVEEGLSRAGNQLTTDTPGVIFVRVPDEWLRTDEMLRNRYMANPHGDPSSIRFQLGDVARSFVRQHRHVVLVEFYSDQLWFGGKTMTTATRGLEIESVVHQFDQMKGWGLLTASTHDGSGAPNWWISLSALAGGKLDNELKLDRLIPKDHLYVYTMEPPVPNWPCNDP